MALVKVKQKFQVVIPESVRKRVPLAVGDMLEVVVQGRTIVLKPKLVVDRDPVEEAIEEGLRDLAEGRVSPAFKSMKEMRAWLDSRK
jgi:AbrB family looped-hinge helix DNA binding protein